MRKVIIQPTTKTYNDYYKFAHKYDCFFEIVDFAFPGIIDDVNECTKRIDFYKGLIDKSKNISMHGLFIDIWVHSSDKRIRDISRERIIENFKIAEEIGIQIVVIHSNYLPVIRSKEYVNYWVDGYAEFLIELLDKFSCSIVIENMFDFNPEPLNMLIRKVNSDRLGVCFDIGHFNAHSEVPLNEWFRVLHDKIYYLHLNDNNGKIDEELAIGKGNVEWEKFHELIKQYGIKPMTVLEVAGINEINESIRFLKTRKIYPFEK